MALNFYITQTQRLLHDLNAQYWTTSELTDYINTARNRIALDTKCLRYLLTGFALTQGVESYAISGLPVQYAPFVADVMGIQLYWGSTRQALMRLSWTRMNAQLRYWQNLQQRPIAFSRVGGLSITFAPIPDQNYVTDWDIAITPNPLISDGTPEQLMVPFTELIPFWAAYEAKFKQQAMGEAALFKEEYLTRARMNLRAFDTRFIEDPYDAG